MSIYFGGKYTSVSQITGPSGFYTIYLNNEPVSVYVDQSYSGGGWVCVAANRKDTGGMNNLTYANAVNTCNYRTGGSSQGSNTVVQPFNKLSGLSNYNIWIGTKFWPLLGYRHNSSYITVVQFVSTTNGTALSATGSHTKRYRWQFTGWTATYGFTGASAVSDETSTGSPGLYNYHAANGFSLTTYDVDRDTYGSNCSALYNNNPYWYGNCWNGNYFAGNGYADAPYWDGSGGDFHQYGAIYIK
jgi:hypothetical protein